MITLPTNKVPATASDPHFLIMYGRPKAGKTSCLAQLDNNLIIDLEGGSTYMDALAIQARTVSELGEIAQAIRAKNTEVGHSFYRYITIDNATRLEEICLSYAATLYRQTPLGKNWHGTDVRLLPNGSGYMYIRQAVRKVIDIAWTDGDSLVGPWRGSVGSMLSAYLMDIIQRDPLKSPTALPYWRFCSRGRAELAD